MKSQVTGVVEGNLELLSQAVLDEAQTEVQQILSQARAKAEVIRQRGQEQAALERKKILDGALQDTERLRRQAIATAQLQARKLQLERREKLLDQVFETARQQLPGVQQWSDYDKLAYVLLREALIRLGAASAQIRADKTTQSLIAEQSLEKLGKELKTELHMQEPLKQGTGVIVETENGRLRYDNTLETRLGKLQSALRSPVYRLLMGESL